MQISLLTKRSESFFWLPIAFLSFFCYAVPFYPYLDSDIAIHVYMTQYIDWPRDLYFWGQDRLGSAVPMLGHLFYRLFGLSPAWAVSISKYVFLIIGYLTFSSLLEKSWQRIILAFFWFFPAVSFVYMVLPSQPYAEQFAFAGLAILAFRKWLNGSDYALSFMILSALLSLWVSELSILFYIPLIVIFHKDVLGRLQEGWKARRIIPYSINLLTLIFGIWGYFLLKAVPDVDLQFRKRMFANGEEFENIITHLTDYFISAISFEAQSIWTSIVVLSALVLFIFAIRSNPFNNRWSAYFLSTSLLTFAVLCSLRWISVNFVMLKYFIPPLIFFFLFLLNSNLHSAGKIMLALCILAGSTTSLYRPKIDEYIHSYGDVSSFKFKGKTGVIGNYWFSYVLGIADPENIRSSTFLDYESRHYNMRSEVLEMDTIYFVKNRIFEEFPDTLNLDGNHFKLGEGRQSIREFEIANYGKLK